MYPILEISVYMDLYKNKRVPFSRCAPNKNISDRRRVKFPFYMRAVQDKSTYILNDMAVK